MRSFRRLFHPHIPLQLECAKHTDRQKESVSVYTFPSIPTHSPSFVRGNLTHDWDSWNSPGNWVSVRDNKYCEFLLLLRLCEPPPPFSAISLFNGSSPSPPDINLYFIRRGTSGNGGKVVMRLGASSTPLNTAFVRPFGLPKSSFLLCVCVRNRAAPFDTPNVWGWFANWTEVSVSIQRW